MTYGTLDLKMKKKQGKKKDSKKEQYDQLRTGKDPDKDLT